MRAAKCFLTMCSPTGGRCGQAADGAAGAALRQLAGLAGGVQPDCGQGPGGLQDRRALRAPQRSAAVAAGYGDAHMTHSNGPDGGALQAPTM